MGVKLWIVPVAARDLVVAGALVSILVNPLMFKWLDKLVFPEKPAPGAVNAEADEDTPKAA